MNGTIRPFALALASTVALAACGGEASTTGGSSSAPATSNKPAPSATMSAKPSATATTPPPSSSAAPATGAIGKLMEDLQANPDNYKDKPIKLDGLFMSTSKSTSGGKSTYTVSVTDAKGDLDHTIGCNMGETAPPEKIMQYTPVAIEGKGHVSNATKGGKEFKSLSVDECKLTVKEEPKKDEPKK